MNNTIKNILVVVALLMGTGVVSGQSISYNGSHIIYNALNKRPTRL